MSDAAAAFGLPAGNPLDSVADFLANQDWVFNRPQPEELLVSVPGRQGTYNLIFFWQAEFGALQFFCECDLSLEAADADAVNHALRAINERLWLGHFDLTGKARAVPTFRHTLLLLGALGAEPVEDVVEIGLAECERHYNVFAMLGAAPVARAALDLALVDEAGVA